ncbi:hypothetical protein K439DRAFT_1368525, partial [Ramaria rubella]
MSSDSNDCLILMDVMVFQIWKVHVMAELCNKKGWGLVDSSEVNPGPSITIYPSYYQGMDSWEIRDRKAHSMIVKYLSNSLVFKHVITPQTLKELWESIISQFGHQNTGVSAFYTFTEIMSVKWDGTSNINKHISKI